MNRRKLLTTALVLGACSLLPVPAKASTKLNLKTLKFSAFYSVDEAVKVQECRVSGSGLHLGLISTTIYNWYTKSYTYKKLVLVSFKQNNISYTFVCNSLDTNSVVEFFKEKGLEYSDEIKGFVTSSFDDFKSLKNEDFNYSRSEINSLEKYFKPTVYTIVAKRPVYELVNPRINSLSITTRGIEPDITYSERRNVGSTYSKCYVVNIPSDIMGELSQIECSKDTDNQWQLTVTKQPALKTLRGESISVTNVMYSPIFKGVEEVASQVFSGRLGVAEYFFTQRVTRYFQSILK